MPTKRPSPDALFAAAERLASDFSLFPRASNPSVPHNLRGLIGEPRIRAKLAELRGLSVDEYVHRTVAPAEDPSRPGARAVLKRLPWQVLREIDDGPLWAAECRIELGGERRRVGILAQDRGRQNGAWMPQHHLQAVEVVREFAVHGLPIVTFMDTPGADAGAEANRHNQAHSISRLIAEMAQIHVPTVGVILGNGYSGGAIPLATTNILLSVPDGVFNTIQPRGLANIARKYNLSWQECAKAVGVSSFELFEQGYLDGIIDWSPADGDLGFENLERAVLSSVQAVEDLAMHFVRTNEQILEHYELTLERFLEPSARQRRQASSGALSTIDNPTSQPNAFGVTYRYLRYLGLRKRVRSTTVESFGRLSTQEIPQGDLEERTTAEHHQSFERWRSSPLQVRYDDELLASWKSFLSAREALGSERGRVAKLILGSREDSLIKTLRNLNMELAFHLYNLWKSGARSNFPLLFRHLADHDGDSGDAGEDADVLEIIADPDVTDTFLEEARSLVLFDHLYDRLIAELQSVAREAMSTNHISRESVHELLHQALGPATASAAQSGLWGEDVTEEELGDQLLRWMRRFVHHRRRGEFLKNVADWKKAAFPTVSEPLFALITFFFDHLLPSYYQSEQQRGRYNGRIRPRNIGIKDFWNRLDRAYKDLLLQEELIEIKRTQRITPERIFDHFFADVEEYRRGVMTADPVRFPGFRISIEQALEKGIVPCGTVAALASFEMEGEKRRVGLLVSNLAFQAGSFDMASGEKFAKLLVRCAKLRLPVVCFVSSGGMQTKEGAGSLFSMSIVNDRITRFVRDNDLPILMFGFGDCTGGAQASMVTHPLVDTYYFSGTSMPFAGQIVVPSHLPMTSTLANYLSEVEGSMRGLVRHPFAEGLDERLRAIDPHIPLPKVGVREVIEQVLAGKAPLSETVDAPLRRRSEKVYRPVQKTLIHARGCTATKLVRVAQRKGVEVVLVQSDPDMDSVAARSLGARDTLVCLGGSTPDESYLNAHSVIRIAEAEGADSIHPGIGFLSESSAFADLCAQHDLNFIGPSVTAMEWMGNKSNAVQTAKRLGIPVVPGSHGVVTSPDAAREVADDIGYPVILKAVHGGGGRGIQIVRDPGRFEATFLRMAAEAQSAFGSRDLYVEKYIERFRHVEIQILRDRHGNTRVLGHRDCSVQRNHQKIIEESGSTLITEELRDRAYDSAARLADEVGYVGAGTVEFIFDLDAMALYFMEMNTRLQVEHPVTEKVTGIDIVGTQFDIAAGGSIESMSVAEEGFSIELRINAERVRSDGEGGFVITPDPGAVTRCRLPEGDDVDVLAAIGEGSVVSPYYDNLVAQLIVHGESREQVIDRLLEVLAETEIHGVGTNIALLERILADETFRAGDHDTTYIPKLMARIDIDALESDIEEKSGGAKPALDRDAIAIENSDELKVMASSQGIFYAAPAPGKPEFVHVGDVVEVDQTLCLLEAMKLFNEISLESFNDGNELYARDARYEIVRVNPSTGQLVTEGDLLFVVRPVRAA